MSSIGTADEVGDCWEGTRADGDAEGSRSNCWRW